MRYLLLAICLTACSPAQLQKAAHYASQAAEILSVGSKVAEAAALAAEAAQDSRQEAVRVAIAEAKALVFEGVALVGADTPDARYEAVSKLSQAIGILDSLDSYLPPQAKQLREEAKAILVGRLTEDLKRVYELPAGAVHWDDVERRVRPSVARRLVPRDAPEG